MYNQQINNLPYPYNQIVGQIYTYQPSNPPCFFQVNSHPNLKNAVPAFIAMVANDISNNANMSDLRRFTYNQMSRNNWQNDEFFNAVQFAVSLAQLNADKNMYPNLDAAIIDTTNTASAMFASLNVHNYDALKSIMPQDKVHQAMQNVEMFSRTINEINNQTQRMQQPMVNNQQMYAQTSGQSFINGGNFNPAPNQRINQGMNQGGVTTGASFVVGGSPTFQQNLMNRTVDDRFASKAAQLKPTVNPDTQQNVINTIPVHKYVEFTKAMWRPSSLQSSRKLFNLHRHTSRYLEDCVSGEKLILEVIDQLIGDEMERDNHVIGRLPGMSAPVDIRTLDMPPVIAKAVSATVKEAQTSPATPVTAEHRVVETTVDAAIFTARKRKAVLDKLDDSFFNCYAYVIDQYIRTPELDVFLAELSVAISFMDVARAIVKAKRNDLPEAYVMDRQMLVMVNDLLVNRLSLIGVTITDFTEDIGTVKPYIEKKYGVAYGVAYGKIENELLNENSLWAAPHETLQTVFKETIQDPNIDTDQIAYCYKLYGIHLVDVLNKDLNFNLGLGESLLITRELTPIMLQVAEYAFSTEWPDDLAFAHILVTSDDVRYKITKAALVKDGYLLSMI